MGFSLGFCFPSSPPPSFFFLVFFLEEIFGYRAGICIGGAVLMAVCRQQGKLESEIMGWEESIVIMETMDQVRKQGGIKYPEKIETTEYPVAL